MDLNGTLVESTGHGTGGGLRPLPGAFAALRALANAGIACPIITVQSRIAAGRFTEQTFRDWFRTFDTTARQHGARPDGLYLCPHRVDAGCPCRKPLTGLYRQAGADLAADPTRSWVIGDTSADLRAAARLGARGILVRTGHGLKAANDPVPRDAVVDTVADAVAHLLPRSALLPESSR